MMSDHFYNKKFQPPIQKFLETLTPLKLESVLREDTHHMDGFGWLIGYLVS